MRSTLVLALLLAATAWAYRGDLALGLTDSDALAHVAAARVESLADLARQVWRPLTGGLAEANANFWRPVTMLHYALLRALFGWEPLGYQVWDLGLHLVAVALVVALVRAAGRPAAEALCAGAILALHPLGVEVVPAVARSIDLLFGLFALAALVAITRGRPGLAFVAGLLAIGAKEVAVVLLPVCALWAIACERERLRGAAGDAPPGLAGARVPLVPRRAAWLALGWGLVVPLFLVGRERVLHGWGGYRPEGTTFYLGDLAPLRAALRCGPLELLFPGWTPWIEEHVPLERGLEIALALVALAAAGAVVAWRRGVRVVALGLAVALAPLVLYGLTSLYSRRLLYVCVAGLALAAAPMITCRWSRLVLVAWLATLAPASPLVRPDDDWRRVDAIARAATDGLASELAALPRGSSVWIVDYPVRLDNDPRRRRLWSGGQSLNHPPASYSVQAWFDARLERPDLDVRFLGFSVPSGGLDEPRVALADGAWRVTRAPLERGFAKRHSGWEIQEEGATLSLRATHVVGDEWLLVVGTPRAVLVPVPRPR